MSTEYKRRLDSMIAQAEQSLAQIHTSTPTAYGYGGVGGGGGGALSVIHPNVSQYQQRAGPAVHADTNRMVAVAAPPVAWSSAEEDYGRQVRLCMKEIAELRSELAQEREGRHQLQALLAKRAKEEVLVEVHSIQNQMRQDMRELEAKVQERLSDSDTVRSLERRKVDDALRMLKAQERSQFDIAEQYRDQLEEMRQRVDTCVAASTTIRTEITHQLETEKGRMEHRLDVELERYAEMHRQHQNSLAETQRSVSREVQDVAKMVRTIVEAAWDERIKTVQKSLQDSLGKFQRTQEQHGDIVATLSSQVTNYLREGKRDLSQATAELRDRLAMLEANAPLLSAQMERVQRKADTAVESNSNLSALVDVLREAADKATVQALRSCERAQKVEDSIMERDNRLLALESQAVSLSGFDKVRNEVDATKRAVQRVESCIDTTRQIADRCERIVDDIQRNVDASADRGDSIEKKAVRAITRLEATEGRINALYDATRKLEEEIQKVTHSTEVADQQQEALKSRVESIDHRLISQIDASRNAVQELSQQLRGLDSQLGALAENAPVKEQYTTVNSRMDKLERRLQKTEAAANNAAENAGDLRDSLESCKEMNEKLSKKFDTWASTYQRTLQGTEKVSAEANSGLSSLEQNLRMLKQSHSATDDTVHRLSDTMSSRLDDIDRRLARLSATGGSNTGISPTALVTTQAQVETLANELMEIRRKYETVERRMVSVEFSLRQQQQVVAASPAVTQVHPQPAVTQPKSVTEPLFGVAPKPQQAAGPVAAPAATTTTRPVVVADTSGLDSGWGGGASAIPSPNGTARAGSETTSVVSSVKLQQPAPKPSQTKFDSDEESSTQVSAVAVGAEFGVRKSSPQSPPKGTGRASLPGLDSPTGATKAAAVPPAVATEKSFDEMTRGRGNSVFGGIVSTPSNSGSTLNSPRADAAPAPAAAAAKLPAAAGTTATAPPAARLAKTAYSSSDESTPPRTYTGVGAPALAKQPAQLPKTDNPFDKETDSDQSFELAQTKDEINLGGLGLGGGGSLPQSRSASAVPKPVTSGSSGLPEISSSQLTKRISPENQSRGESPLMAAQPVASVGMGKPPMAGTPTGMPLAATSAPPAAAPRKTTSGGWTASSEDDVALPSSTRQPKHYVSTTGDSSEGSPHPQGSGAKKEGASAEAPKVKQYHGATKKAVTAAATTGAKKFNDFDDETDDEEDDDDDAVFDVSSKHSSRSGGGGAAGGARSTHSKKTISVTGSHVTDVSLTITPSSKAGTKKTKGEEDEEVDEELGDDELAAMF
jgi:hypothetical protein